MDNGTRSECRDTDRPPPWSWTVGKEEGSTRRSRSKDISGCWSTSRKAFSRVARLSTRGSGRSRCTLITRKVNKNFFFFFFFQISRSRWREKICETNYIRKYVGCLDDIRLEGKHLPLPPAMNGTQWGQATMARNLERNCPSNKPCANVICPEPFECIDLWNEYDCTWVYRFNSR